jgi:hypothetical protein
MLLGQGVPDRSQHLAMEPMERLGPRPEQPGEDALVKPDGHCTLTVSLTVGFCPVC